MLVLRFPWLRFGFASKPVASAPLGSASPPAPVSRLCFGSARLGFTIGIRSSAPLRLRFDSARLGFAIGTRIFPSLEIGGLRAVYICSSFQESLLSALSERRVVVMHGFVIHLDEAVALLVVLGQAGLDARTCRPEHTTAYFIGLRDEKRTRRWFHESLTAKHLVQEKTTTVTEPAPEIMETKETAMDRLQHNDDGSAGKPPHTVQQIQQRQQAAVLKRRHQAAAASTAGGTTHVLKFPRYRFDADNLLIIKAFQTHILSKSYSGRCYHRTLAIRAFTNDQALRCLYKLLGSAPSRAAGLLGRRGHESAGRGFVALLLRSAPRDGNSGAVCQEFHHICPSPCSWTPSVLLPSLLGVGGGGLPGEDVLRLSLIWRDTRFVLPTCSPSCSGWGRRDSLKTPLKVTHTPSLPSPATRTLVFPEPLSV
ncbi:MAG: hypothetical protein BJ554DRAFT_3215 [Olpidium bornovanus]|uniref:Uncharacterized protein n=1 Tax=Olpidium bornovanus TaxID=278681 RepID=A0A8H8DFQ3_9FUNG|nr:MAG: hypothetical protein BJ554DRAFT_3215 [Olpidium bornovanus]